MREASQPKADASSFFLPAPGISPWRKPVAPSGSASSNHRRFSEANGVYRSRGPYKWLAHGLMIDCSMFPFVGTRHGVGARGI